MTLVSMIKAVSENAIKRNASADDEYKVFSNMWRVVFSNSEIKIRALGDD